MKGSVGSKLQERNNLLWRRYKTFVYWAIVIILIESVLGYLIFTSLSTWPERSAFGEMFGVINTLFSGLAFAGVIFAIVMQRKELRLQRREFKMNREQLRLSAEAQEKAERALNEQAIALQRSAKIYALSFLLNAHIERKKLQVGIMDITNITDELIHELNNELTKL